MQRWKNSGFRWSAAATLAMLSLMLLGGVTVRPAHTQTAGGQTVGIIDGDTVEIDGKPYDLFGIDAPELGQRCLNGSGLYDCGVEAAQTLRKRASFNPLDCRIENRDTTPEQVVCHSGDELVETVILRGGLAIVTENAPAEYEQTQAEAHEMGMGLWRGGFIPPAEWRQGKRLPEEAAQPVACPVIALPAHGSDGIYLVPGDERHKDLKDRALEEERFCNDEAARDAGYGRLQPGESQNPS